MKSYALIADPDPSSAALYIAAAMEEGLTYVSVRDGAVASAVVAERGAPDLLVTDLAVPSADRLGSAEPGAADGLDAASPFAIELIESVRRAPAGAATVVVVVSADRDQRERVAELRTRLDIGAVLAKEASPESVRRMIKRLLAGGDGEDMRVVDSRRTAPLGQPELPILAHDEVRHSGVRARGSGAEVASHPPGARFAR